MRRPNRLLTALPAAALLFAAPAAARAQALDAVAPSARIRVDLLTADRSPFGRARTQSVVGTLAALHADTVLLVVRPGADPLRVPRTAIRGASVSHGRLPRWRSALRSAVAPALIGAALGAVTAGIRRKAGDPTPGQAAAAGAAWGALSGAAHGAWSPKERWQRLSLPAAAPAPVVVQAEGWQPRGDLGAR